MLAVQRGASGPLAVGDLGALPVRDGCVDAAAAGFVLNHLPPEPALREMARAVRPGGVVFASTWDVHGVDPVKSVIDHRLRSLGWVPPVWYRRMKEEVDPISGDPERLARAARRAGLVDVGVAAQVVDVGLRDPAAVVAYRLATPHIAPWVAGLAPADQDRLRRDLAGEVAVEVPGWRPAVVFAHGWVRSQSRSLAAARSRVGA
ncbi:MAG TPA: methyltransferase domain-containing protein, partial [Acidimicrobiales bacterium]